MRPIDTDAIKLPEGFFEKVDNVPKFYDWLNSLPTIDAVPVVRCKDCKYYNTIGVCNETSWAVCEDSFCCWAERKDDGTD